MFDKLDFMRIFEGTCYEKKLFRYVSENDY